MELRRRALHALQTPGPQEKVDECLAIWNRFGTLAIADGEMAEPPGLPGRPVVPSLIAPTQVPQRSPFTDAGRAALIHAICHIEFNAINTVYNECLHWGHDLANDEGIQLHPFFKREARRR